MAILHCAYPEDCLHWRKLRKHTTTSDCCGSHVCAGKWIQRQKFYSTVPLLHKRESQVECIRKAL